MSNENEGGAGGVGGSSELFVLNIAMLGKIRSDWPDDFCTRVEPDCLDPVAQATVQVAWMHGRAVVSIDDKVINFVYGADDEEGDKAGEQVKEFIRSYIAQRSEWGLDADLIEDVATIITCPDLSDVWDGDDDERGWRCETARYDVSDSIGSWGELPEEGDEGDFSGGFYLSVVGFTDRDQLSEPGNVEIQWNDQGEVGFLDLSAAISDMNHDYFVGVLPGEG